MNTNLSNSKLEDLMSFELIMPSGDPSNLGSFLDREAIKLVTDSSDNLINA